MKKKYLLFTLIFILFCISSTYAFFRLKPKNLSKVLETSSYSYLPKEAKNFIEKIYEETGEIILTEKNKQVNIPYLNPIFIDYLTLPKEKQEKIEEIPPVYALDPISLEVDSATYPASYDLRNVGGKNFITPIKNQETLDLCWAFTSIEQIESMLLKQANTSYSSSSKVFSPRQMDYATSSNGIRSYENEYGMRELTKGGNFLVSSFAMANGITLTNESEIPFTTSTAIKELKDVINYGKSQYELTSSEMILNNSYTKGTSAYDNYISYIKNMVTQYGGVYVSTQAPGYSCSSTNSDGYQIIDVKNCQADSNHAMQIIGWNDNYSYSYCKASTTDGGSTVYYHSSNTGSCSSANKVTGTGAWILRNSWGTNYQYAYLAYDSPTAAIYTTTGISSMSSRKWDNVYYDSFDITAPTIGPEIYEEFSREIDKTEKVEQVKFHTYGQGGTYEVSIYTPTKTYLSIKEISVPQFGYATIDLSSENIYIVGDVVGVDIKSKNGINILNKSISLFTSNYDDEPIIEYPHYTQSHTGSTMKINIYALTKNIPSNTNITFKLYDSIGNNVTSKMSCLYNTVAHNDINMILSLNNSIPNGIYTLKSYYGSKEFEAKIIIDATYQLEGGGTESDPFLIHNEEELRKMSVYMDGYYRLENDIVMTQKWVPIGIETNPFYGVLDGAGHKIENLVVSDQYKNSGLFGVVKAKTSTAIKNLTIKNATISGQEDSAILIGTITGEEGYDWIVPNSSMTLDGIYIIDGTSYSDYGASGSIIGSIQPTNSLYHGKHTYTFNNLFSSATVGGITASGMIGKVVGASAYAYQPKIVITNLENIGIINLLPLQEKGLYPYLNTHAAFIGNTEQYSNIQMKYYIISPLFRGFSYTGEGLIGTRSSQTTAYMVQGYNTLEGSVSVNNLKETTNYNSWTNFYDNWKIETINYVKRIPILTGANIDYTDIPNITMQNGETVKISDYVSNVNFSRVYTTTVDDELVDTTSITDEDSGVIYDMSITAHDPGYTYIHVINNYDGFETNIMVTVEEPMTSFSVSPNEINIGEGETYTISPIFMPANTTDEKTVTWSTTNSSIATVEPDGTVTGVSQGTTTITGILPNEMNVTVTVHVIEAVPITSFIISNEKVLLNPSSTWTVTTLIDPQNATQDKKVTWTSSDESIAIVNSDGTITGVGEGVTTITGTLNNGMEITTTVTVTNDVVTHKRGDLNYDTECDLKDVVVALRKIFRYLPIDEVDLEVGDVDDNEEMDLSDVVKMIRYIFKYIDEL